jgi:protein-L-isoaspartate(D-aspartate) O-methyltransferase
MGYIELLIKNGTLVTPEIIRAFSSAKRNWFLPENEKNNENLNMPLPIGYGQTNSQPETVALMLELLRPSKGENALDAGCGSGWTTALLSELVGGVGKVFGVEIIPELCRFAEENLRKHSYLNRNVQIICSDAKRGLVEFAPFDVILISAASSQIPPNLISSLAVNGRLLMPVGKPREVQTLTLIRRISEDKFEKQELPGFAFVPLI